MCECAHFDESAGSSRRASTCARACDSVERRRASLTLVRFFSAFSCDRFSTRFFRMSNHFDSGSPCFDSPCARAVGHENSFRWRTVTESGREWSVAALGRSHLTVLAGSSGGPLLGNELRDGIKEAALRSHPQIRSFASFLRLLTNDRHDMAIERVSSHC